MLSRSSSTSRASSPTSLVWERVDDSDQPPPPPCPISSVMERKLSLNSPHTPLLSCPVAILPEQECASSLSEWMSSLVLLRDEDRLPDSIAAFDSSFSLFCSSTGASWSNVPTKTVEKLLGPERTRCVKEAVIGCAWRKRGGSMTRPMEAQVDTRLDLTASLSGALSASIRDGGEDDIVVLDKEQAGGVDVFVTSMVRVGGDVYVPLKQQRIVPLCPDAFVGDTPASVLEQLSKHANHGLGGGGVCVAKAKAPTALWDETTLVRFAAWVDSEQSTEAASPPVVFLEEVESSAPRRTPATHRILLLRPDEALAPSFLRQLRCSSPRRIRVAEKHLLLPPKKTSVPSHLLLTYVDLDEARVALPGSGAVHWVARPLPEERITDDSREACQSLLLPLLVSQKLATEERSGGGQSQETRLRLPSPCPVAASPVGAPLRTITDETTLFCEAGVAVDASTRVLAGGHVWRPVLPTRVESVAPTPIAGRAAVVDSTCSLALPCDAWDGSSTCSSSLPYLVPPLEWKDLPPHTRRLRFGVEGVVGESFDDDDEDDEQPSRPDLPVLTSLTTPHFSVSVRADRRLVEWSKRAAVGLSFPTPVHLVSFWESVRPVKVDSPLSLALNERTSLVRSLKRRVAEVEELLRGSERQAKRIAFLESTGADELWKTTRRQGDRIMELEEKLLLQK